MHEYNSKGTIFAKTKIFLFTIFGISALFLILLNRITEMSNKEPL